MNPIVSTPTPGVPNYNSQNSKGHSIWMIIAIVSGVLALLFLALTVVGWSKANSATNDLNVQKQKSYQQGKADQAKTTDAAIRQQLDEPYRVYTAPSVYGNFVVSYPKTWQGTAAEDPNGNQLILILHPDIIKTVGINNYATRLIMTTQLYSEAVRAYTDQAKKGKLKSSNVTVSGIEGTRYDGTFDNKKVGSLILLPVRDKTMSIWCEDNVYLAQYNEIVGHLKITP